ncbi:hypothetical protein J6590_087519 [Homalodisca vitripennis]|nr:hypothetical protein J6590_087519 [Homalodisca vitripennis]
MYVYYARSIKQGIVSDGPLTESEPTAVIYMSSFPCMAFSVHSVPEIFSHTASVRSTQFSRFLSANLSSRQTVGLAARILCVGFFSAIKCDCAMSSSSDEETAVVALTLAAEEDDLPQVSRKKRRFLVHSIIAARNSEGQYHTLFPRLKNDNVRFFRYFRMSYEKFMELLHIIEPELKRCDTTFRRSISPEERLAVTLR